MTRSDAIKWLVCMNYDILRLVIVIRIIEVKRRKSRLFCNRFFSCSVCLLKLERDPSWRYRVNRSCLFSFIVVWRHCCFRPVPFVRQSAGWGGGLPPARQLHTGAAQGSLPVVTAHRAPAHPGACPATSLCHQHGYLSQLPNPSSFEANITLHVITNKRS